jgi:hypothetical protein
MKTAGLILVTCLLGAVASFGQEKPSYEQKPLPPGPILDRAPLFSTWQIAFVYGSQSDKGGGSGASTPPSSANAPGSTLPRLLTVTRTTPQWHAVLLDVSGNKREVWYNGSVRFTMGPKDSDVGVSVKDAPGFSDPLLDYNSGPDFPDVEWVSPDKYLGMERGTPDWVFQDGPNGAMVWIDSTTHFPVQWQRGGETRTIQFLAPPSGQLVLPDKLQALATGIKHIQDLENVRPGHV